ncbi:MAG: hypothetical protein AAF517_12355, partial [Planctomycetota bacterium]
MRSIFRIQTWFAGLCVLLSTANVPADDKAPSSIDFLPGTQLSFATVSEAKKILSAKDVFVKAMSPFDRKARLRRDRDVSVDEYLKFVAGEAREFSEDARKKLREVAGAVAPRLAPLKLRWPKRIQIALTSGGEEGGAAYCRGLNIVFPVGVLKRPAKRLERLLIHELFHIYSRYQPKTRDELYQTIGFERVGQVKVPPKLDRIRLTNPDAPLPDVAIRLKVGDAGPRPYVPLLYSKTETYDETKREPFFR